MQDIAKYVMAEAAKSNVEKRKVVCIITDDKRSVILAKGYNQTGTPDIHAEDMAIQDLLGKARTDNMTAYVSHPPCPKCAAYAS